MGEYDQTLCTMGLSQAQDNLIITLGLSQGGLVLPGAGSRSAGRVEYYTPHRVEPDLTAEEVPTIQVVDYSGWSLPDLIQLLAEMRPTGAALDDITHRIKLILPGKTPEIVEDPLTNLRIILRNVPRKARWSVEKDLKRILIPLLEKHEAPRQHGSLKGLLQGFTVKSKPSDARLRRVIRENVKKRVENTYN